MAKIYLMQQENSDLYKIGFSNKTKLRKENLQTGNPEKIKLIKTFESSIDSRQLELSIHAHFRLKHYRGEWFTLEKDDVDSFEEVCRKCQRNLIFLKESGNSFF